MDVAFIFIQLCAQNAETMDDLVPVGLHVLPRVG